MYLTSPFSWPVAKILDCCVGEHTSARFNNRELTEMLELHERGHLKEIKSHMPEGVTGLEKT